ncbi:MAG: anhydro-N-acetylmuramic acid kinase [Rhodocyclaceae bacterium]|nr:anhydro-N-acetylmuramic acid kinase [Rhodocyclaceae bacterium]
MPGAERLVGLMSGTSLDGVDAVLVEFRGDAQECIGTHYLPYPDDLKAALLALHARGNDEIDRAAGLANRLADLYADAVAGLLAATGTMPAAVRAVACHGQTVRHVPERGYTVQLNSPARLVEATGIAVVADFRSRDIAAGGQGAPLVPAFHAARFGCADRHRVVLNIGGIANLTDLAPGQPVRGFDTGPGNLLMDAWIRHRRGEAFDRDGKWAAEGCVRDDLLARLLAHPYFAGSPPKSCGREQFHLAWLDGLLAGDEQPADVQATLAALTVASIADAIHRWCGPPDELLVCGGGAHNATIMAGLAARLPGTAVDKTDAAGVPADWVEAIAFAWLGKRTLDGLPGNLPEVTGARGSRVLGVVYPA